MKLSRFSGLGTNKRVFHLAHSLTYILFNLFFSGNPTSEHAKDEEGLSSSTDEMNTSLFIVLPTILALATVLGVIGFVCFVRQKREFNIALIWLVQSVFSVKKNHS